MDIGLFGDFCAHLKAIDNFDDSRFFVLAMIQL